MNKLYEKLSKNGAITLHALLAGLAYFVIVMRFIVDYTKVSNGAILLGIFFFPAIICGSALMLIKLMRNWRDQENLRAIFILAICNLVIFVLSIFFAADIILNLL